MRVKIKILIVLLAFSVNGFGQEDTATNVDQNAGKKEARLTLQMSANDTMHVATATVSDAVTRAPLNEIEVIFYVQRTFGLMNVGDGTTDTTGTVSLQFPLDTRPGDKSQQLIVIARIEDNENFRDTSAQAIVKSKVPFPADKPIPRALIGARAPWWLIFSFFGTVGIIYGLFLYAIILVYKIKKASTHSLTVK